jgi:hypothetical protein
MAAPTRGWTKFAITAGLPERSDSGRLSLFLPLLGKFSGGSDE